MVVDQAEGNSAIELFDLNTDPGEEINLRDSKPEVVQAMQRQLFDWQESVLLSLTGRDYR